MKRILVVEDDSRLDEFYTNVFQGHQITFCTNAEEAIEKLNTGEFFNLVLLDLELLGISGFSVLECLEQKAHRPPVIVCSSITDPAIRTRAMQAGAAGYLEKPVQLDALLNMSNTLLAGRTTIH